MEEEDPLRLLRKKRSDIRKMVNTAKKMKKRRTMIGKCKNPIRITNLKTKVERIVIAREITREMTHLEATIYLLESVEEEDLLLESVEEEDLLIISMLRNPEVITIAEVDTTEITTKDTTTDKSALSTTEETLMRSQETLEVTDKAIDEEPPEAEALERTITMTTSILEETMEAEAASEVETEEAATSITEEMETSRTKEEDP